jgi:FixJ family two-component response regulator
MSRSPREAPSRGRDERERHAASSVRLAGDALVFLVDDDEAVRDAVATSLRGAGFAVASFGSARQFLDAYRRGQHGCLIVDLDLAGVEPELLRMLASTELALPVIITSRRLRRRASAPTLSAFATVLLEKPFGVDDLLPLVQAAIASNSDRN